jgi:hypothetical protein
MSGVRIHIVNDGYGRLRVRWWADDSALWHQILVRAVQTGGVLTAI